MTDRERTRYDALKRVKQFKADHAADFPAAGTPGNVKATALFTILETSVANVAAAVQGRAAAEGQYHAGTDTETVKRSALMLDLAELNRAAAAIAEADGNPGLMENFRMPWGVPEAELPGAARAMIAAATAISARFVELDFPAGFATALEQRVVDFETAGGVQEAALGQQAGFTGAFDDLLSPGLKALKQLDVLCRRRFRSDAVKLGAWATASHIERQSSGGGAGGGGTPPPVAPQVPANATFTQANPGDAVEANADPSTGATIYRVYVRPAGTTGDPVLQASAATLPTSFTLGPGDYEFTMTAGNDDAESAPTDPPVVLTVA